MSMNLDMIDVNLGLEKIGLEKRLEVARRKDKTLLEYRRYVVDMYGFPEAANRAFRRDFMKNIGEQFKKNGTDK